MRITDTPDNWDNWAELGELGWIVDTLAPGVVHRAVLGVVQDTEDIMIRSFLSFVEEDLNLVNLFRGQAKNEDSELEFADFSIKEPFDSTNAEYIGGRIAAQLKLSSVTICLYGPTTYTSKWVEWELRKSLELGKPIMGVCLYGDGRVRFYPAPLEGKPRVAWNLPDIVRTIRQLVH